MINKKLIAVCLYPLILSIGTGYSNATEGTDTQNQEASTNTNVEQQPETSSVTTTPVTGANQVVQVENIEQNANPLLWVSTDTDQEPAQIGNAPTTVVQTTQPQTTIKTDINPVANTVLANQNTPDQTTQIPASGNDSSANQVAANHDIVPASPTTTIQNDSQISGITQPQQASPDEQSATAEINTISDQAVATNIEQQQGDSVVITSTNEAPTTEIPQTSVSQIGDSNLADVENEASELSRELFANTATTNNAANQVIYGNSVAPTQSQTLTPETVVPNVLQAGELVTQVSPTQDTFEVIPQDDTSGNQAIPEFIEQSNAGNTSIDPNLISPTELMSSSDRSIETPLTQQFGNQVHSEELSNESRITPELEETIDMLNNAEFPNEQQQYIVNPEQVGTNIPAQQTYDEPAVFYNEVPQIQDNQLTSNLEIADDTQQIYEGTQSQGVYTDDLMQPITPLGDNIETLSSVDTTLPTGVLGENPVADAAERVATEVEAKLDEGLEANRSVITKVDNVEDKLDALTEHVKHLTATIEAKSTETEPIATNQTNSNPATNQTPNLLYDAEGKEIPLTLTLKGPDGKPVVVLNPAYLDAQLPNDSPDKNLIAPISDTNATSAYPIKPITQSALETTTVETTESNEQNTIYPAAEVKTGIPRTLMLKGPDGNPIEEENPAYLDEQLQNNMQLAEPQSAQIDDTNPQPSESVISLPPQTLADVDTQRENISTEIPQTLTLIGPDGNSIVVANPEYLNSQMKFNEQVDNLTLTTNPDNVEQVEDGKLGNEATVAQVLQDLKSEIKDMKDLILDQTQVIDTANESQTKLTETQQNITTRDTFDIDRDTDVYEAHEPNLQQTNDIVQITTQDEVAPPEKPAVEEIPLESTISPTRNTAPEAINLNEEENASLTTDHRRLKDNLTTERPTETRENMNDESRIKLKTAPRSVQGTTIREMEHPETYEDVNYESGVGSETAPKPVSEATVGETERLGTYEDMNYESRVETETAPKHVSEATVGELENQREDEQILNPDHLENSTRRSVASRANETINNPPSEQTDRLIESSENQPVVPNRNESNVEREQSKLLASSEEEEVPETSAGESAATDRPQSSINENRKTTPPDTSEKFESAVPTIAAPIQNTPPTTGTIDLETDTSSSSDVTKQNSETTVDDGLTTTETSEQKARTTVGSGRHKGVRSSQTKKTPTVDSKQLSTGTQTHRQDASNSQIEHSIEQLKSALIRLDELTSAMNSR